MIWLLALPLAYLMWRTLARGRIEYTHREAFTLGNLYYMALPLAIASTTEDFGEVWLGPWRMIARLPGQAGVTRMIVWSVALWACFLLGDALARRRGTSDVDLSGPIGAAVRDRAAWTVVLTGGAIALGLFGAAWAVVNRAILFTGYANFQETAAAGALQAAIAFMTYISVTAALLRAALPRFAVRLAVLVLGFLGVLTLSTGGRQTFVLALIAALVCRSVLRDGVPRRTFVALGIAGVLLFGFIGAWRSGVADTGHLFGSIAAEPLFTFLSFTTLVAFTYLPAFAFPTPLISSFGNIVPSVIWSDKLDYFKHLLDQFRYYSPLGALSLGASMLINFGWIGALVAATAGGFGVERLRQGAMRHPLLLASYCIVVPVLTLDLWRNPMEIPIVKNMFEVGLLLPVALLIAKNLLAARPHAPSSRSGTCAPNNDAEWKASIP